MNKSQLSSGEQAVLLARLRKNYTYDEGSGLLCSVGTGRLIKPQSRGYKPYKCINLKFGGKKINVYLHRAVWAVCYGRWPERTIDHIDGDPTNNRIGNLREVSQSENGCNTLHQWRPNKVTGVPGVYKMRNGGFNTKIRGKEYSFRDPYTAFHAAFMLGKRYRI